MHENERKGLVSIRKQSIQSATG